VNASATTFTVTLPTLTMSLSSFTPREHVAATRPAPSPDNPYAWALANAHRVRALVGTPPPPAERHHKPHKQHRPPGRRMERVAPPALPQPPSEPTVQPSDGGAHVNDNPS